MRKIFLVATLIFLFINVKAQSFEVGIFGGTSHYYGDLSSKRINLKETNPALGAFARYNFNQYIAARLSFTYAKVSESDKHSNLDYLIIRNLSFRSRIIEFALIPEWNILGLKAGEKDFTPYIFAGIAIFNFNPEAFYINQWVELQPLGTEGQGTSAFPAREKYRLTEFAVPAGAGIKMGFGEMTLSLETGIRATFTDYLDDVSTTYIDPSILLPENGSLAYALSNRTGEILGDPYKLDHTDQRGNPAMKDFYLFTGLTLSLNIGSTAPPKGNLGCPKF